MKKSQLTSFIFALSLSGTSLATIWHIGPTHDFTTPNSLYLADQTGDIAIANGDTIFIDPGDYIGTDALAAWQQDNLYIAGIAEAGEQPHLIADGEYILGKGIWVCVGNNITVKNIEFSGAVVPDHNGAGIRLDGIGLTLDSCYFHHNENGLLTSNPYDGDILIQYCEFAYNGFGDGFTHNMYIGHVNSFTLQFSYSHHTNVGHNVKSRANTNHIMYNRITDEETGNSSRLIDLPNGGYSIIKGNVLMQGPAALNNNAVGYGKEGVTNAGPNTLYFVHNTLVNKRVASCNFLDIETGTLEAHVLNNIFAGSGNLLVGEATVWLNNYAHADISHFSFADEPEYDYNLQADSPVIDSAILVETLLVPAFHYVHKTSQIPRIVHGAGADIGAYEYISPAGIREQPAVLLPLPYPNPTSGSVTIPFQSGICHLKMYTLSGALMLHIATEDNTIDLSGLGKGSYILEWQIENQQNQALLIVE